LPTGSLTSMGTLQLFSVGMQKNRHGDHAEHEAGQAQADDENNRCRIHWHTLLFSDSGYRHRD